MKETWATSYSHVETAQTRSPLHSTQERQFARWALHSYYAGDVTIIKS